MKYFKNVNTLNALKREYRMLAVKMHPDKGGNTEDMQELNAEFEQLYKVLKITCKANSEEKPEVFINRFYTENGWCGSNYNSSLTTTDIAKIIRTGLKQMYPLCKFSVRTSHSDSISVYLMEANFNPFACEPKGYYQINQYHIEKDENLSEQAKQLFVDVNCLIQSYNYDDSDAYIDYFDTNFYYHLEIGKWDKPFMVVEKTLRIGKKPNIKDKKITIKEETV